MLDSDVDPELCCTSFLGVWVLVLVCFPPVVKGPRDPQVPFDTKPHTFCCRLALSLAFLIAGEKETYPPPTFTALLPSHLMRYPFLPESC